MQISSTNILRKLVGCNSTGSDEPDSVVGGQLVIRRETVFWPLLDTAETHRHMDS
jgi:hypothetical protein